MASEPYSLWRTGLASVVTMVSLSLTILAYKRALEPLYASAPTQNYLSHAILGASALGTLIPFSVKKSATIYGILLAIAPHSTYWTALYSARWRDPILGPVFTHVVVLVPLISAGVSLLHSSQGSENTATRFSRLPFYCFLFPSLEPIWNLVHPLLFASSAEIFFAFSVVIFVLLVVIEISSTLQPRPVTKKENIAISGSYSILSLLFYVFVTTLISVSYLYVPTLHTRLKGVALEPYIDRTHTVRILSSVQSNTGIIVVGEALAMPPDSSQTHPTSLRYLRASHSLLGGVWIGDRATMKDASFITLDSHGTQLGDSIYTTFALQEAVRLVNSTTRGDNWSKSNALIIGLGAGFAPTSLQKHGISTTIVEIDPAVYSAARTYFGLPDPGEGNVFLEDARGWITNRRKEIQGPQAELFDIVIHDCFSGGGVPSHVFTVEFWQELKDVVKPDGVVAINFAGKPDSKSARAVVSTLLAAFGQCRAFFDSFEPFSEQELKKEFLNLVFFCIPLRSSTNPMTFRPSREDDYLGSHLRAFILGTLEKREIDLHAILQSGSDTESMILTDNSNPLDKWQREEALHHWKLMREVLPDVFWEMF